MGQDGKLVRSNPRRHGGAGVTGGPRGAGRPLGKVLPADKEYVYTAPSDTTSEPRDILQKYPDDFSPGIIPGYSKGLWGKGLRSKPPEPNISDGEDQWGDPSNDEGWYR